MDRRYPVKESFQESILGWTEIFLEAEQPSSPPPLTCSRGIDRMPDVQFVF
jgi:hypothetical protein